MRANNRFEVDENTTAVTTLSINDADEDPFIEYRLSREGNYDLFKIDQQGALSFREAPNYEPLADTIKTNGFQVYVIAVTGKGERRRSAKSPALAIVPQDVNDAPSAPVLENQEIVDTASLNYSFTAPTDEEMRMTLSNMLGK